MALFDETYKISMDEIKSKIRNSQKITHHKIEVRKLDAI
jgi:hypothetical protein